LSLQKILPAFLRILRTLLMSNEEKHVFGDGKYCIFERDLAERRVCFYGALVPLHEPEDEPGGDCRGSRRREYFPLKSESGAPED
jgi:hypothetical protein